MQGWVTSLHEYDRKITVNSLQTASKESLFNIIKLILKYIFIYFWFLNFLKYILD